MIAQTDYNLSDAEFRHLRRVVHAHCGIALNGEKIAMVRARIAKQIRARSFSSASEYLECVLSDPSSESFTQFIDAISTNLTHFFREREHFDYLATTFLPMVCARKNAADDRRLRVWSAACSTGEEPYSLAMTILDVVRGSCSRDIRILASDISTRVLQTARAGIYEERQLSSVPADYRRRFFNRVSSLPGKAERACEVSPELRAVVRFRRLNLMDSWPFTGPFDFIFCRNVMIYFDKPTQERLVGRFWNCLAPGGLLFTGHAESLMGIAHRYANKGPSIYEKPWE